MVTHVVLFCWRPEATEAQIADLASALDRFAEARSGSVTIRHGPDLHFRDGNADYALIASFADKAAWDAYQADPAHKALVHDFVAPIQASRLTIQF